MINTVTTQINDKIAWQYLQIESQYWCQDGSPKSGAMTAPNGKPTNLSKEQWDQVRTEEIKAWFGDWEHSRSSASKAIDKNGKPLVVFHGTGADFDVAEFNADGIDAHFGTFEQAENRLDTKHDSGRILPLFLRIAGVIELDDQQSYWNDPQEVADSLEKWERFKEDDVAMFLNESDEDISTIKDLKDFLMHHSIDGITYMNAIEYNIGRISFIVFNVSQIQLAGKPIEMKSLSEMTTGFSL